MKRFIIPALALMLSACGNIATERKPAEMGYEKQHLQQSEGVVLSERDELFYEKTLANVVAAENSLAGNAYCQHIHAGAAQKIQRSDGFHFFKTGSQ